MGWASALASAKHSYVSQATLQQDEVSHVTLDCRERQGDRERSLGGYSLEHNPRCEGSSDVPDRLTGIVYEIDRSGFPPTVVLPKEESTEAVSQAHPEQLGRLLLEPSVAGCGPELAKTGLKATTENVSQPASSARHT